MTTPNPTPSPVPIDHQLRCVKRELSYRERVYAKRVSLGRMTQKQADYEIEVMRAVEATLRELAEKGRLF